MPASEFEELYLAEQIDPFGEKRLDYLMAHVLSTFLNVLGKPNRFITIEDCLPREPQLPSQPITTITRAEQDLTTMLAIQAMHNLAIERGVENTVD